MDLKKSPILQCSTERYVLYINCAESTSFRTARAQTGSIKLANSEGSGVGMPNQCSTFFKSVTLTVRVNITNLNDLCISSIQAVCIPA